MKILDTNIKIVNIITAIILLLLTVLLFQYFGIINCIKFEDIIEPFIIPSNLQEMYTGANHGCFVSTVFHQFLLFILPKMLNIHPDDFYFIYIFQGFIYWLIPFLIARLAVSYSDEKYFLFFYAISNFLFFSIFFNLGYLFQEYTFIYTRFIRYVFPMIFFVLFWSMFSDFYILGKYRNWRIYLAAFLTGLSVEPLNITTFVALILITIFSSFNKKISNNISSTRYLAIVASFCAGLVLFYANPNFWHIANERGINRNLENFHELLINIKIFQASYFEHVLKENTYYLIFIAVLFFILLRFCLQRNNQKSIKVAVVSVGLLIGILFFNYILFLSGKTFYDGVSFWLVSLDLKADTTFVLVMTIVFLVSYIFGMFSKKNKIAFVALIVGFVLCGYPLLFQINLPDILHDRASRYQTKQLMYKAEKIYRFCDLKHDKSAYLPLSAITNKCLLFSFNRNQEKDLDKAVENAKFPSEYYYRIYGVPEEKMIKVKFVEDSKAYKYFYDAGGTFTKEELSNLKFTKLLENKFVIKGNI